MATTEVKDEQMNIPTNVENLSQLFVGPSTRTPQGRGAPRGTPFPTGNEG